MVVCSNEAGCSIAANGRVLGDSSRLALDFCVGRLFRQTHVIYQYYFFERRLIQVKYKNTFTFIW